MNRNRRRRRITIIIIAFLFAENHPTGVCITVAHESVLDAASARITRDEKENAPDRDV